MNSRTISSLIVVLCLAAGGAWWWLRPVPAADRSPAAHEGQDSGNSAPGTPPATADLPAPGSVAAGGDTAPVAPAVPFTPASGADPRADLGTAIQNIIRIAETDDFVALVDTNIQPEKQGNVTPEIRAMMVQQMQALAQSPAGQQQMRDLVGEMQAIQIVPPVFDATGDRATFNLPSGVAGNPVVFVRVKGLWYRD